MKPLHKIEWKDDTRPFFYYAQVKNGFVAVVTPYCLVKLPAEEVFGKGVISDEDEFYIEKRLWGLLKFHTAVSIEREDLTFKAFNRKGQSMGSLTALLKDDIVGRFPDYNVVFPTPSNNIELAWIGINPELLLSVCEAFGVNIRSFRIFFFGTDKVMVIKSHESKGIGLVFPCIHEDNVDFDYLPKVAAEEEDDLL